jgi:hypothetical protein
MVAGITRINERRRVQNNGGGREKVKEKEWDNNEEGRKASSA